MQGVCAEAQVRGELPVRGGLPPTAYTGGGMYPKRLKKYIFTGKSASFSTFMVEKTQNLKNRLTCAIFGIIIEVIH
jgi:hypothetical protein